MKRFNGFMLSALLAASAVGCATAGTPQTKGDEEEAQAAKNENAPKPPSSEKIQAAQQQQQAVAKQPEKPKISASVKAEFDGAVRKWEAAKKANTERQDCRSLASAFSPHQRLEPGGAGALQTPAPSSSRAATTRARRASTRRRCRPIRATRRR